MCRTMLVCLILTCGASVAVAEAPEKDRDKSKTMVDFLSVKFAELNRQSGGLLTEYFQFLGAARSIGVYISDHSDPKRHQFFQEFLVQVLADAIKGNVGETMFADFVIQFTPRKTVLEAIFPEIGSGGRLQGILQRKGRRAGSKVAKYIQGDFVEPVFDEYVKFLYFRGPKSKRPANESARQALIGHMFSAHPERALVAMLRLDYDFNPYLEGYSYPSDKQAKEEIRKLQLIGHEISDYLYRMRYEFTIQGQQQADVKTYLDQLSEHQKWWVRLYVAEIMRQHAGLRQPKIIERLKDDKHPLVRETIAAFAKKADPWEGRKN